MTSKQINATSTTLRAVYQIGFWSAILTTTFNIAIALGVAGASTRSVAVGASLLLTFSFTALTVSIHNCAPPERKIWIQIGLSFAIVYAALLIWNYYLQLTVVRNNPPLYECLTKDFTPDTAFWLLETIGCTFVGLAAMFALLVLNGSGIERAIRWCFAALAPRVPWYAKVFLGLVVAYTFSPIDLIPDFISVLGYLDDLVITPLGIVVALKR